MMRPWTRNKTLLLTIILLSLVGIYFISSSYIITPLKTEAEKNDNEINVYESQIKKIENHDQKLENDVDLNEAILQIPNSKSSDDVLFTIQKLTEEAKVIVESMSSTSSVVEAQDGEEPSFASEQIYSLDITADKLIHIDLFLDKMVLTDRLLTINTLQVEQSDSKVTASITFTAYHTVD